MGVKKYQQWVRKHFPERTSGDFQELLAKTKGSKKVRRLFLDLNALIHGAVNKVYSETDEEIRASMEEAPERFWAEVAEVLTADILEIVDIVKPEYLLYLGADGAVSKAKMLQQRQRTYKSTPGSEPFNRNNVKPGTEFMATLTKNLRILLKNAMIKRWEEGEFTPGVVEFSDASRVGEGEHKIIERMADRLKVRGFEKMVDVVYSPDSDLHFLLMLNVPHRETAIIMREVHKQKEGRPKYEYFDVTGVREDLEFRGIRSKQDFSLIACFGGNDFIPALPFIKYGEGDVFEAIKTAYTETFTGVFTDDQVYGNWGNLLLYLRTLSKKAEGFLRQTAEQQLDKPDLLFNAKSGEDRRSPALKMATSIDKHRAISIETAFFDMKYNQKITGTFHSTLKLEPEEIDYDYVDEMCHAYLEGLTWVLEYYLSQGKKVNLNWSYNYHYAPNIDDLISYLERNSEPTWTRSPLNTSIVKIPFTPVEQLLAVLRADDLHLLPRVVSTLFLDKLPSLYPDEIRYDYTLVPFGKEHDGVALINFPDMQRIRTLFAAVRDDPSVIARNEVSGQVKVWPTRGHVTRSVRK